MAQRPAAAAAQPVRGIGQELASIAEEVGLAEHFLVGEMDVNLLEELGRGSDAAVYKARWQGAWVAAKVLHPILIQPGNEGRRRKIGRFLRECAVLGGQPHPHVTQCMGVGFSSDGQLLILLELMEATLSSRFTAPEPDSQRQCWVYVRDIAAGLAFLHSRGIIHRDVKPDNCLVRFGHAKLSDVGLARQLDGDDFVARGTRVPGTIMFMPPEAFKDGVPYGKALDVFGIGVTVLCVFIRKEPDRSAYLAPRVQRTDGREEEIAEVERRQVDMALLPARHLSRPIIVQCIANNPAHRPSADALVDVFEAQLQLVEAEAAAQQSSTSKDSQLANVSDELQQTKAELLGLKDKVASMDARAVKSEQDLSKLQAELGNARKQLEESSKALDVSTAERESIQAEADKSRAQCDKLEECLKAAQRESKAAEEVKKRLSEDVDMLLPRLAELQRTIQILENEKGEVREKLDALLAECQSTFTDV